MNRYKVLISDTFIFAIGSVGTKLIMFLLVPLYTNYMTTSEYGTADWVLMLSSLIMPVVSLTICQGVIRYAMAEGVRHEDVALSACIVLAISTLITIAITFCLYPVDTLREWRWYLCVQTIMAFVLDAENAYLKSKRRNRSYAFISIVQTSVLAISNVMFIKYMHMGVGGYLMANNISMIVAVVAAFFASGLPGDLHNAHFSKNLLARMIKFSAPVVLSDVSLWMIQTSDRTLIRSMVGDEALGIYTVSVKIPALINVVVSVFNSAWTISSIREVEGDKSKAFFSAIFNAFTTMIFALAIFVIIIIKPLMKIYVGEDFVLAWMYVPFLVVGASFAAISVYYGAVYRAYGHTLIEMIVTVVCAAINITLNFSLIGVIGVWGSVAANVTAYFAFMMVLMICSRSFIKIAIKPVRFILNVVLVLACAAAVTMEFNVIVIGILVVGVFLIINIQNILKIKDVLLMKR